MCSGTDSSCVEGEVIERRLLSELSRVNSS